MDTHEVSAHPRAQTVVIDRSRTRTTGLSHVTVPLTSEFVVVGNHLAQHPELSLVAIGVSVHIQSLPPGRRVGIKALAERFQEGAETIARAMRELERCGYLDRPRDRVGEGRFMTRTIAYNHPDAAHHDRAARAAVAERQAAGRRASGLKALGRRPTAVPRQRAGSPATARRHGTRPAHVRSGAQQRPVREMCTASDALRELWEPVAVAAAIEDASPAPATAAAMERPRAHAEAPAKVLTAAEPDAPDAPLVEAVRTEPDAPPQPQPPAPAPAPPAPAPAPAAPAPSVPAAPAPPSVPNAASIRASLPQPVRPAAPTAAELARLAVAAELLSGLRGEEKQLRLSEKDVRELAPTVAVWLERGVHTDQVREALLGDLPAQVKYPAKFLAKRLTSQLPPPLPLPTERGSRPAPNRPAVLPMQNCPACDRAFRAPEQIRCDRCLLADAVDPGIEPPTN
ncbi:hypothetical protein [Streptomyces sp. NPDC060198]|uniref:hypothetical protein n=1 Tax=Streptomyces sp. NPDC060198 TaxID=3347070 RepID=UPI0036572839